MGIDNFFWPLRRGSNGDWQFFLTYNVSIPIAEYIFRPPRTSVSPHKHFMSKNEASTNPVIWPLEKKHGFLRRYIFKKKVSARGCTSKKFFEVHPLAEIFFQKKGHLRSCLLIVCKQARYYTKANFVKKKTILYTGEAAVGIDNFFWPLRRGSNRVVPRCSNRVVIV